MSENTQELTKVENEAIIQKLADTFEEQEKKQILRDMFIVTQIKTISVKEEYEDSNGYTKTKTVKKKMTPFQAIAYVMLCRDLKFNPALNLVTMLEDTFYIGLEGHKTYAQSTGLCMGIESTLIQEKEIDWQKKEYVKGSKTPNITMQKGMQYHFECVVKKRVGEDIISFKGTGIADPSNVVGGDKATNLKLMQMAEARAKRRALDDAFPPGVGHIEDVTEYPDYNLVEAPSEKILDAETSDKFKKITAQKKPKVEDKPEISEVVDENIVPETPVVEEEVLSEAEEAIKEEMGADIVEELFITDSQKDLIIKLYKSLGYDDAEIPAKIEFIETKMKKKFEEITVEQADIIISSLRKQKAEKDRQAEETQEWEDEEEEIKKKEEETKVSAVGKMGAKAKADQEAIKNSPEFKAAFPEDAPATVEDVSAVFDTEEESKTGIDLNSCNEGELKELLSQAKIEFSEAMKAYRADGSNEKLKARTASSDRCAEISKVIIEKGYPLS